MDLHFSKEIQLENDRVLLRPLQENDWTNLLKVASEHENLVQYSPIKIHTEAHLKDYIRNCLDSKDAKSFYPFIIFDKQTNEYAGSTSFMAISNKDKRLEIGSTWIGKGFQRTGLNRQCKFLLMQYAFDVLEFERVELKTDERNTQSRNAIQAIGGQFEGIFRSHTVMNDDFRRNTVYYSILKNEWQTSKANFPK